MSSGTWQTVWDDAEWDRQLAELEGHPLQSSLWGNARRNVDSIKDERWAYIDAGRIVLMARVESRPAPLLGPIAWIPRGPAYVEERVGTARQELADKLAESGYVLLIDNPYPRAFQKNGGKVIGRHGLTAILQLSRGREQLWRALNSQWRYGVGRAARQGVLVEQSTSVRDVAEFAALCESISEKKSFALPGSRALMQFLIDAPRSAASGAYLFLARVDEQLAAGAIVIGCGKRLHYFWGGTNRALARARAGEAVQWAIVEWACAQGFVAYDLEGLDPIGNPGTYHFKSKMGGDETVLAAKSAFPLGWRGQVALRALQWRGLV